jgi:hypothetical protein
MAVRKCSKCSQLFRVFRGRALFERGVDASIFAVGPLRQREALVCSPGISWRTLSLVEKTLRRHRDGFEPQRASPFMKRENPPIYSEKPSEPER